MSGPSFRFDAAAPEATSASLIERVRAESPEGWRTFVAIYNPLIYRWCRRMGVHQSDAADISQEVFRSVARQVGQFRRRQPGDSFRAWLYTITQNKSRDYLRRRRGRPQAVGGSDAQLHLAALADPTSDDDDPHDLSDPAGDKSLLAIQVFEQLRGEFGQPALIAFWRMVVDGQSAADVAAELAMSPKAVRQAKFRVLRRLRAELRELE